jgi:peptidoglycan/LPS O-acetylase OafA/YrhL
MVGACVVRQDNGLGWFLRWKPMSYIGVVSYGMYMLNVLVLDVLKPIFSRIGLHHPLPQFPIAVLCTVLGAGMSYRLLETPFLRLKERFSPLSRVKSSPESTGVLAVRQ